MDRIVLSLLLVCVYLIQPSHAAIISSSVLLSGYSGAASAEEVPEVFDINTSLGVFVSEGNSQISTITGATYDISMGASGYSFSVYEGVVDTEFGLPSALAGINTTGSHVVLEAHGTVQGGAASDALGFDSSTTFSTRLNAALVIDLSSSSKSIFTFAADLLDFEGGNGRDAYWGVYDVLGERVTQGIFGVLNAEVNYGNDEVVSFFARSDDAMPLGSIVFAVGDDSAGSTGGSERLAIADIYVQGESASVTPVPLPAAATLFLFGLVFLVAMQRTTKTIQI